ncbi:hypothetical protein OHA77_08305 [Streptosporangium sp. NBC_01639]|uniref:hypothetical protein n=1 Tax=Streptosporangium sp. NBC_01639 TaxID=2975948 RepID=UPI00386904F9|nr:hypothetical protein OHA77_08305 [Streptosporangium sp. NBC_01639]
MAEFVGIDPAGARRLISSMGDAVQRAKTLRPSLSASIAEAGPDWPAGPGAEVLDNVGRFLSEAQRDLTWRVQTIERVEKTTAQGGLTTAELPFGDASSARAAGTLAGEQALAAWRDYLKDPGVKNWEKVQATLREGRGRAADPAYSTGLLTTLGATAFGAVFATVSARNQNDPRGYSPDNLKEAGKDLKPLAEAFASADAAGTLPKDLRDHALGDLPIGGMAALLGLARQSREFVLQAGAKVLQYGGNRDSGKDWNTYWLVKALSQDVGTTQRFLTTGDNAALLLRPEVVNGLPGTDFEDLLATALDRALAPGAGDAVLRRDAWLNIIDLYSRKNFWPALKDPSPVGRVLATHISQYFPDLIAVWRRDRDSVKTASSAEWEGLKSDAVVGFIGGLLQSPEVLVPLKKGYGDFLRNIDLGKDHPFGDAPTEYARQGQRDRFYGKVVTVGALASLLFSGLHEADLSADDADKAIVELLVLPLDVLTAGVSGKFIDGVVRETFFGKALDLSQKNPLKDTVESYLDGERPGDASDLVEVLVDAQVSAFNASRQSHGRSPLSRTDLDQLKAIFSGQLTPVLSSALEARGG